MARFQAQTNVVLDEELEDLRERLGLRANQKADLLREIASLAAWVLRQAEAGRTVEARQGREVETLESPVLDRLRERDEGALAGRIDLTAAEVKRLARVLDRGFSPTPTLRRSLARLASPSRRPPKLRWKSS